MIKKFAAALIRRAETRLGVSLDYTHAIARADIGLLARYNRIFGFLDPNRKTPAEAYHAARLIGARSADCGTCVEAEINLAKQAGLSDELIAAILKGGALSQELEAVARLARAVTDARVDDPEAREAVLSFYGEKGLIELSFAMNGAALLPGIKRAMGYATACDLNLMKRLNQVRVPSKGNSFQSEHAALMIASFQQLLKRPLLTGATAEALYRAPFPVLSHNGAADPVLTYGNLAAQTLWEMSWEQLTSMPSRLTAEPAHRDQRDAMFAEMRQKGFIENYAGVRISASGRRFEIRNAVIWSLLDAKGLKRGEAAMFQDWHFL